MGEVGIDFYVQNKVLEIQEFSLNKWAKKLMALQPSLKFVFSAKVLGIIYANVQIMK